MRGLFSLNKWIGRTNQFLQIFGREMQEDEIAIQIYDGKREYTVLKKE